MEERKIQLGDIVRLKTGRSPEMVVESEEKNTGGYPTGRLQCIWYNDLMIEHRASYHPAALRKVEEEEEYVITYIVLLFINYENLRREQEGEPEMTEEEEEEVRESLSSSPFSSRIREMAEAVRNGVVDTTKYLPLIEQVRKFLSD